MKGSRSKSTQWAALRYQTAQQGVILVLGGTGVLRPAVEQLMHEGESVVVVVRRASRLAEALGGDVIGVDADWTQPAIYSERYAVAMAGCPVRGVILWVHHPYRDAITDAIEPLLAARTRLVRL